mgnify:FL=1|jgi:hypothetical protein
MCQSDLYPTEYNLKPVTLEKKPSITDVEVAALKGVDLAERAAEPVNRYSIARGVIRLSAHIARKFR